MAKTDSWDRFITFCDANNMDSAKLIEWWIKEGIAELFRNPDFMKWAMDEYRAQRR